MSMKERGARIEMGTEDRIGLQRLCNGSRHLREKSRKRKRGRCVEGTTKKDSGNRRQDGPKLDFRFCFRFLHLLCCFLFYFLLSPFPSPAMIDSDSPNVFVSEWI